MMSGHVIFEIRETTDRQTDRQTDVQTCWSQYLTLLLLLLIIYQNILWLLRRAEMAVQSPKAVGNFGYT